MMHNEPLALDKTLVEERKFADVFKETYSRVDGIEARCREAITEAITRFTANPASAIEWRAEAAIANQTTLSIIAEVRMLLNHADTMEAAGTNFESFAERYRRQIISWSEQGENSSSAMSNIASRITLAASAKFFGSWGYANEIERAIAGDIEETKKRVVVQEFVDLKVNEHFRLSPDTSTMLFRKLSPRKAVECVYPINTANKQTIQPRTKVYLFRVPLESDVLYAENGAVAA